MPVGSMACVAGGHDGHKASRMVAGHGIERVNEKPLYQETHKVPSNEVKNRSILTQTPSSLGGRPERREACLSLQILPEAPPVDASLWPWMESKI